MLIALERAALCAGEQRAKEIATLAVVGREGIAPAVSTEGEDFDAVRALRNGLVSDVYETPDALLITTRERSQDVSKIVRAIHDRDLQELI